MRLSSRQLPCRLSLILTVWFAFYSLVAAMKKEDFKTCAQSGFCRRHRAYADMASSTPAFESPYTIVTDSIYYDESRFEADVRNTDTGVDLTLQLQVLQDHTARVRINEKQPIRPRYEEHGKFTLHQEPVSAEALEVSTDDGEVTRFRWDDSRSILIHPKPLRIEFLVDDAPVVTLNERNFFHFEHLRTKDTHKPKMIDQTKEDGSVEQVDAPWESDLWEETFKSWTDPKPNGPESLSMDITFHNFEHVYGIPEHASSLSLKETRGGDNAYTEPYRLYNTDVFEYALDSPTSLYGAVPFMVAHSPERSAGVFWMNPSETWIDIVKTKADSKNTMQKVFNFGKKNDERQSTQTHWMSEAGVLDVFVFLGPTPKDVLRQYMQLTGPPMLPQLFALGYHQCRWNYINQKDVLTVDEQFDEHDMPYDVIWLDIEYLDDRKYFTWEKTKFPDPISMEKVLDHKGRQLVVIIDPHIKRADNYRTCEEAKDKSLFVKKPTGEDYEAWCWPGQSSWVDFNKPEARQWWKEQFRFDKFDGTRENVHIWNDMNEPSIFNGPEITMQKEMIHDGNWEHRVLHNMYSLLSFGATADGVRERTAVEHRPFVLTRGFYAGAQRYGAVWTGDNMANWEALYYSNPMSLTNGMGGIVFTGADIPGFFFNPTSELLVRWYQAGVFQPFFRGHAHIDTKRREPYLVPEPYRTMTRAALRERYALLPYWYTIFYEAHKTGTPMMRPMMLEFPEDESLFAVEDQFMVGSGIMVKPVTTEGAVETDVIFAGSQPWYDMQTHAPVKLTGRHTVKAPLEKMPAYYRGGHIVARRERVRRSSHAMALDPFTFVVALDTKGQAQGELYLDDGESYDFETGAYIHSQFTMADGVLIPVNVHENPDGKAATDYAAKMHKVRIERLHILGVSKKPNKVQIIHGGWTSPADFEYDAALSRLTLRDPKLSVADYDWKVQLQ